MASHCPECKAEVEADAVFCHVCGYRLDADDIGTDSSQPKSAEQDRAENRPEPTGTPADKLRTKVSDARGSDDAAETQLWEGGYSGKAMVGTWILAGVVVIAAAVASFMFCKALTGLYVSLIVAVLILGGVALLWAYRKLRVHYVLTTQRFIHRAGILRRVTDRIEMIDIDDVTFEQGLVERLMGVGSVKIISSDRTHPELWLLGIENVQQVAGQIDDVRREERRRRGLHIEAI